jgi:TonB family protein
MAVAIGILLIATFARTGLLSNLWRTVDTAIHRHVDQTAPADIRQQELLRRGDGPSAHTLPPPPPIPLPVERQNADEETFVVVESPPTLIGGIAKLQREIRYPTIARKAGIQGRVFLQFVVQKDGTPADIIVVRGIGAGCDEEAVRALREMIFTPGRQRGEPVRVRMTLPVTFQLR